MVTMTQLDCISWNRLVSLMQFWQQLGSTKIQMWPIHVNVLCSSLMLQRNSSTSVWQISMTPSSFRQMQLQLPSLVPKLRLRWSHGLSMKMANFHGLSFWRSLVMKFHPMLNARRTRPLPALRISLMIKWSWLWMNPSWLEGNAKFQQVLSLRRVGGCEGAQSARVGEGDSSQRLDGVKAFVCQRGPCQTDAWHGEEGWCVVSSIQAVVVSETAACPVQIGKFILCSIFISGRVKHGWSISKYAWLLVYVLLAPK